MSDLDNLKTLIDDTAQVVIHPDYALLNPKEIAQAIINAGWTPPPKTPTCANCGEQVTGDKYAGDWMLKKPQGQQWQHIHRGRCPIQDRTHPN